MTGKYERMHDWNKGDLIEEIISLNKKVGGLK